jgi:hypothetical protein
LISMVVAAGASADIPGPGPRPRPPIPLPPAVEKKPESARLVLFFDNNLTTASLELPARLPVAATPFDGPRMASTLPRAAVGLTLAGSLIVGGLWLVRRTGMKLAIGLLPLGIALIGLAVHAQPARLESPRTVIETGKVRISRNAGADVQLILPKRVSAPSAK